MTPKDDTIRIGTDLLRYVQNAHLTATQRRDMKSAILRICEMAGSAPQCLRLEAPIIREVLRNIRPAAHGVSEKTWANLRSLFGAALEMAWAHRQTGPRCRAAGPRVETAAADDCRGQEAIKRTSRLR